ncbi:MAG: GNAT family N-acetyltransferase [Octadecabacter sp.]|nr:GNAT family N-acetyltransferase [Octadecabacter sp.]
MAITIRPATPADWPVIWAMIAPVFRAGETYAVDRDITEPAARALWLDGPLACFVAEDDAILGTYYIKRNHQGGAAHICNCGYITSEQARGRGVARAMCLHSQTVALEHDFTAMQFNLVLASNAGAVALWQNLGFGIAGTLPAAFDHPKLGLVDAYVMWKAL